MSFERNGFCPSELIFNARITPVITGRDVRLVVVQSVEPAVLVFRCLLPGVATENCVRVALIEVAGILI